MEPKFVSLPAFDVVGTAYTGNNANQEIAQMWEHEFNPRWKEIKHAINTEVCYGVCLMPSDLPQGHFRYLAAVEVSKVEAVPQGMEVEHIPACKYAVFEHRGALDKLGQTYQHIYEEWLPKSGLKRAPGPDLEYYNSDFKDFSPDSILYLYVPVEE